MYELLQTLKSPLEASKQEAEIGESDAKWIEEFLPHYFKRINTFEEHIGLKRFADCVTELLKSKMQPGTKPMPEVKLELALDDIPCMVTLKKKWNKVFRKETTQKFETALKQRLRSELFNMVSSSIGNKKIPTFV